MRVLHLSQRYWPAIGGAEGYLAHISEYLVASGHRVTVATTDALDIELFWNRARRRIRESQVEHRGVNIRRFPVRHLPFESIAYAGVRRLIWLLSITRTAPVALLYRLSRYTPWVPELWRWLAEDEGQYDLVAASTICFEPLILAGLRYAQRHGLPFICYPLTHLGAGARPGEDALSRFYTMRHQVALARASNAVVAMTRSECEFYVQQGLDRKSIAVIGPGISPDEVLGGDGAAWRAWHGLTAPMIASLSTLMYDKGTVHLVEAVRRLWRAGRQVELVLAGTALEAFTQYLASLPAADRDRIRVLGHVSDPEKRDLLAAADIFAMPSRSDSFGIVYLEAWLYGKPVIGARTWGVTDVIDDGKDGLLVPFGDVDQLAAALGLLLDNPQTRAAMGQVGCAKVYAEHTWDKKLPQIEALYGRVTGGKR